MNEDRDLIDRAVRSGDLAALSEYALLLDDFPVGKGPEGYSWLSGAVAIGDVAAVRWMIEAGADPNPQEPDGFSLLQTCIDRPGEDRCEVLALLLAAGTDPGQRGFNDWTALHHAAIRDDFRAIRMLIDAGADRTIRTRIDDYATAEEEARNLGHLEAADLIRDHVPAGASKPVARRRRSTRRGE